MADAYQAELDAILSSESMIQDEDSHKYSYMTDEHETITIQEKKVNIGDIGKILKGESNSTMLTFAIDRFYDGVDLYGKSITIICERLGLLKKDCFTEDVTNIEYSSSTLKFSWVLSEKVTCKAGIISAAVQFTGRDETGKIYALKTSPFALMVEDTLDGTDMDITVSNDWFTSIESRLNTLENASGLGDSQIITDYTQLNNIPTINGVKVTSAKSLDDYGIAAKNHSHAYTTENQATTIAKKVADEKLVGYVYVEETDDEEEELVDLDVAVATSVNAYLDENNTIAKKTEIYSLKAENINAVNSAMLANELGYRNTDKPVILLYVDDCKTTLPDVWAIAQEYGIPLNVACPTNTLTITMSNGQTCAELLHDMEDAGCEIFSHSIDTTCLSSTDTREIVNKRLKESKEALLAEGFTVNGFCYPGGSVEAGKWEEFGMDDLVRQYYLYSDTGIYPYAINKGRTSLGKSTSTTSDMDAVILASQQRYPMRKLYIHGLGTDINEEALRYFISTALTAGFEFVTERTYYQKNVYSLLDDRLKILESLESMKYSDVDYECFMNQWGICPYDKTKYPYVYIYGSGVRRIVASTKPLYRNVDSPTIWKTEDESNFSYQRYVLTNFKWEKEHDYENVTQFNGSMTFAPKTSNYDVYSSDGTLLLQGGLHLAYS